MTERRLTQPVLPVWFSGRRTSVRMRSWDGLTVLVRVRVGRDLTVMENGSVPMCTVATHSLNLSLAFTHEAVPLKDAFGTGRPWQGGFW